MSSPDAVPQQVLRIVDASLNRVAEGLRVLEDVARLGLDDDALTAELKSLRHDLVRGDRRLLGGLLSARDSAADVGVDIDVPGGAGQRDIEMTVVANARRAQESLRTLEELAKLSGFPALDSEKFKHGRFRLYEIEKDLVGRVSRRDKARRVRGLYVLIDTAALVGRGHLEVARQALRGGARVIQLRDKTTPKADLLELARQLAELCAEHGALFIMNDYLDIAVAGGADGLHLGPNDLPVAAARKLVPIDMILGRSTTSPELAAAAEADGVDYIAVGSMFPTPSKETAVVIGPETLARVREMTSLPLVAIGGIDADNAAEVIAAGADAVAVISAVVSAPDVEAASRRIAERFEGDDG